MWSVTLKLNTNVSDNYTSLVERSVVDDILSEGLCRVPIFSLFGSGIGRFLFLIGVLLNK